MKKIFALALSVILAISVAGCGELSDLALLEKAYANMENLKSSKSNITLTVSVMGMTMDPVQFAVWSEPDKTYMDMNIDLFGFGETTRFQILVQGDDIQMRSEIFEGMEDEIQEEIINAIAEQAKTPQQYEGMFLDARELTNFTVVDNPGGLAEKEFKSFKLTLDCEELKKLMPMDELRHNLQEILLQATEEVEPAEIAEIEQWIEDIIENFEVEMEAIIVINTKTKYFHKLTLDTTVVLPMLAAAESFGFPEKITTCYKIVIDYLEINTDLTFPDFK